MPPVTSVLLRFDQTMVFRFSEEHDKEMMRELLRLKPFSAPRGTTVAVWEEVAKCLSTAIGVELNAKQIRDRLKLLKKTCQEVESAARIESGVEHSLNAVNVQSHYTERDGYVLEYISLEQAHKTNTQAVKDKKQKKEEDLARCAEAIVQESTRRRAKRNYLGSEDENDADSDSGSTISSTSTRSSSRTPAKRSNAFLEEVRRQEKRQKLNLELRERELQQAQQQFEQRLHFDKKIAEDRLQFEERVQQSNRALILECAKLFSSALAKND